MTQQAKVPISMSPWVLASIVAVAAGAPAGVAGGLSLSLDVGGSYTVSVGGRAWLASAATEVHAGGGWYVNPRPPWPLARAAD